MFEFDHRKAVQALNYFAIRSGGTINKLKAIKLIWLSDRAHLRRYARPIFMDQYFALKLGPVPSYTKDLAQSNSIISETEAKYRDSYLKIVGKYDIRSIKAFEPDVFSKTDISILQEAFNEFGNFNKYQLSNLSHLFPEWKRFENGLTSGLATRCKMDYVDFFDNCNDVKTKLFCESEELTAITKELFLENFSLKYDSCKC